MMIEKMMIEKMMIEKMMIEMTMGKKNDGRIKEDNRYNDSRNDDRKNDDRNDDRKKNDDTKNDTKNDDTKNDTKNNNNIPSKVKELSIYINGESIGYLDDIDTTLSLSSLKTKINDEFGDDVKDDFMFEKKWRRC